MGTSFIQRVLTLTIFGTALVLVGCSTMDMGSKGAKTTATGSAGGANAEGANAELERCDKTLGTMSIIEDTQSDWYYVLTREHRLGAVSPVLRLLAQQSNCFVIVERGAAMNKMMQERELMSSGELRGSSNYGKGQIVAADFTLTPQILFSDRDAGGGAAGFGGIAGSLLGGLVGSMKRSEAATLLTLIDNRSGVQLAVAEGSARNTDWGGLIGLFGSNAGGALGTYSSTAEGKVIIAALTDAYNNVVRAARNYKMQTVEGGLGTGKGGLQVQPEEPVAPKKTPTKNK